MQVGVGELAGCLHPVEQMEVEVVAAGAAVENEGQDGDAGGEWNQEVGEPVALHVLRVSQWLATGSSTGAISYKQGVGESEDKALYDDAHDLRPGIAGISNFLPVPGRSDCTVDGKHIEQPEEVATPGLKCRVSKRHANPPPVFETKGRSESCGLFTTDLVGSSGRFAGFTFLKVHTMKTQKKQRSESQRKTSTKDQSEAC